MIPLGFLVCLVCWFLRWTWDYIGCRRLHRFSSERRFSGEPFLQDAIAQGEQCRTEEYADEAECEGASEDSEKNKKKGHRAPAADQPWLYKIVDAAHADPPNNHEDAPARCALMEQPKGGGNPNERRTHRHHRKKKRQQG